MSYHPLLGRGSLDITSHVVKEIQHSLKQFKKLLKTLALIGQFMFYSFSDTQSGMCLFQMIYLRFVSLSNLAKTENILFNMENFKFYMGIKMKTKLIITIISLVCNCFQF